jgi:uncharacterized damage-inducible protein DinB
MATPADNAVTNNPYANDLQGADPLESMAETSRRIESLVRGWTPEMLQRSYAPGKWSARQLLTHLVHAELIFSERIRFALSKPDYVVVPFDQDEWLKVENAVDGASALAAYTGLRRMNLAFFRSLTPEQRRRELTHPERGTITVDWILVALAGHDRHHLPHLETIARSATM